MSTAIVVRPPRTLLEVFQSLPEDAHVQLIENNLVMSPAPAYVHQRVLMKIISRLLLYLGILFLFTVQTGWGQSLAPNGFYYRLKKVIPVAGRQGIAIDSQYYYVSSSTGLYQYDKNGKLLLKNEQPFTHFEKEVNHFGDIDVFDGDIYTGVEYFNAGDVKNIQIAVYNAATLEYKYSIDFGELEQPEVAGITIDGKNHIAWMVDWTRGWYVYKYDLKEKKYLGKVHLQPVPQWQQGAFFVDGKLLITADDGDADLNEPDNIYWVDVRDGGRSRASTSLFRTMTEFKRAGEIEGLSIDPVTNDLVVLNNRGAIIKMGMPSGFYPGYDEEIHELYIFERIDQLKKKR